MKKAVALFSLTVVTVFAVYVALKMSTLPPTYEGIAKLIVGNTIEKTGAINSVTAVVFDFRGYDTLGESIVLLTAVTGASAILRKAVGTKGGH